ncbi:DMT family transporter [Dongia rigui]|uniref:DMT family transporter n=1 Tax=Dongia rigui TaxID=940149 RepID=A0ABU5DVP2_9PROT|nr:DMT family transporter [Dongia rigui]MDY0871042.1 DMT family transporter [Dongia rigui]
MPLTHIALAVFIQILWGPIYTLAKPVVGDWFSPVLLVTVVYATVALLLSPFYPRAKTPRRTLFILAFFGCTLQSTAVYYGLKLLPASMAVLLMQLSVPVAIVASWVLGRDKPNLKNGLGALLCLAGVAVVVGKPDATSAYLGIFAMLVCAISWATTQAVIPVVAKDHGTALYAALARYATPQMIVAALLLEGQGLIPTIQAIPLQGWLGVVGIAAFGFALPYSIWYWLLMRHRVDELTPFTLLMPVFGVVTATWHLGEPLSEGIILGGGIILLGLGIIVWRGRPRIAPIPPAQ